ncbi:MAG: bifunctional oligoribonuclease/PAP phosphatase NrnA [Chloroflexi bacterium]|nr:bifunctional oligoribonuclease/PAP phosphatase NrnA [Chloroflexota bacterium]
MTTTPQPFRRTTTLAQVADILCDARRVLAISHVAPDGDAVGSLLGLGWVLRGMRPDTAARAPMPASGGVGAASAGWGETCQVCLALADPVPTQFRFLPGAADIVAEPPAGPWDAVVALDASDPLRLGKSFRPETYGKTPVIVLDHHVTNLYFGALNYVDIAAAATSQIVVGLADALGAPIGCEAAICLLTGLVMDTLSFRTSNVNTKVMSTAVRLMEAGANLAEITERAMNHKPLNTMRLWGLALADLRLLRGQVIWTHITQTMRRQVAAPDNGDSGLVGYLINAPEAKISAVFSETSDGRVEIGFRARPGYDVSGVALSLGGGGHPQAAGCTVPGPLITAEARVLPMLLAASRDT